MAPALCQLDDQGIRLPTNLTDEVLAVEFLKPYTHNPEPGTLNPKPFSEAKSGLGIL